MPLNGGAQEDEPLLAEMKSARKSPAVLKTRLVSLRSALPTTPIFAIEGIEDKAVYFQWVQRARPGLDYEPFPCGGKKFVLQLLSVLSRDLTGLKEGVFFLVDRDFDDWAGHTPSAATFMTDRYSTENYLVDEVILDLILKDELHCHAAPEVRARIVALFNQMYKDFLSITSQLNFRIYCAKRLNIEIVGGTPEKITQFVEVSLQGVTAASPKVDQLIPLAREPTCEELMDVGPDFGELSARERYRGKYALQFFLRWIQQLGAERLASNTHLFQGCDPVTKVRYADISMGILASRSALPTGFHDFVMAI